MLTSPSGLSIAAIIVLGLGYWLYDAIRPKPIPGIPYHKPSGSRLFGDIPDALKFANETGEQGKFMTKRCYELDSPIFQLFLRPFRKPWVVVYDPQEATDVMMRRTRQFDRSYFMGDQFAEWMPNTHMNMETGEGWRAKRKLIADTMSPRFLNTVAAPHVYEGVLDLIDLWQRKMHLANERCFDATQDAQHAILDAIWSTTFGHPSNVNRSQTALLSATTQLDKTDKAGALSFPQAPYPEDVDAVHAIIASCYIPLNSPLPRIHHRLALRFSPTLSSAMAKKDQMLRNGLDKAWSKVSTCESSDQQEATCAADVIVRGEMLAAEKQSRSPDYNGAVARDELMTFFIGGYDTTSSTVCWGLKLLTTHQDVQENVRRAIKSAFSEAEDEKTLPSATDITKCTIPLLEAVIEEILRVGGTGIGTIRRTLQDTEVLGHVIPKGTDVFFLNNGPGIQAPPFKIDPSKRSATSIESQHKVGYWKGDEDITAFRPERWLKKNDTDEFEFDPKAGPANSFGAGPRACFGKRLAYMELRILLVMVLWNFKLLPVPPELSSYAAIDAVSHKPQFCYVRLAAAE